MKKLLLFLAIILVKFSIAQQTFPVNGPVPRDGKTYAFTHATIYVDYQTILKDATLLVSDDKIIAAGNNIAVPEHAIVYDLTGKFIYPSFIDLYSNYGLPEVKRKTRDGQAPQFESQKTGPYYWNESIHPEINASELFNAKDKDAELLRNLGFGTVLSHQTDGICRGTGALVTLGSFRDNKATLFPKASQHFSFSKGASLQTYPSSLMGSIALLRQTYLDAQWYSNPLNRDHTNLSLQAMNDNRPLPTIFEANDKYNILRAAKIAGEFGQNYIYKGSGDEYQRAAELKEAGARLIIPVNFPDAFDVTDPIDAMMISFADLKHWEWAPANASVLEKSNLPFAITADGLKEKKDFLKNLRKAVQAGLSEEAALKALTFQPANFVGAEKFLGSLKKGYIANFIITSDNIFKPGAKIYDNWVQGVQYVVNPFEYADLKGKYQLRIGEYNYDIKVSGQDDGKVSASAELIRNEKDTVKSNLKIEQVRNNITLSFEPNDGRLQGTVRLSGQVLENGNWKGKARLASGDWLSFSATRLGPADGKKEEKKEEKKSLAPANLFFPNIAYGQSSLPAQGTYLLKNATVWTNEKEGVLKNTDVLILNGKIHKVGQGLQLPGATEIDATGKHITPGIIDEHSHIAISRGVNEGGQAISAEVSIGDVVNPDDVNIYRQLAGGVTAAQLLHGSANPIGGQSALIKLKYGATPEKMKIQGADKFIKFALGENVKQSNWGEQNTVRYPQTRMGVEQLIKDAFTRAREYEAAWKKYKTSGGPLPRKDLELETLLEILNNKRFITCHSYVQSEINMLMKLAEELGFRVNTFTHILEGYKVADKMATHGAAGSTFSDWWAYKYEVKDAIPYNAALLHEQGVLVAINSDDAEMARRLNQEAAKTVKYGGVPEEEALKFVTLNPAKILHLDERMGSLKAGKDADLVIWSDHPLSVYAKAEKTFIEGAIWYDAEKDQEIRRKMDQERERIVQLMLDSKKSGEPARKIESTKQHLYHCDDLEEE